MELFDYENSRPRLHEGLLQRTLTIPVLSSPQVSSREVFCRLKLRIFNICIYCIVVCSLTIVHPKVALKRLETAKRPSIVLLFFFPFIWIVACFLTKTYLKSLTLSVRLGPLNYSTKF